MSAEYITRQRVRMKLLKEIYDQYYVGAGSAYQTSKNQLAEDSERKLAFLYLEEKGLIRVERKGNQELLAKPTVYGMEYVEQL